MIPTHVFKVLPFSFCVALSNPLQVADDKTLAISAPQKFTYSILNLNESTSILNGSSENANIQCDSRYGLNPTLSDCESAKNYFLPGSEPIIFGERHSQGLPETAIALPYLLFGGCVTRNAVLDRRWCTTRTDNYTI